MEGGHDALGLAGQLLGGRYRLVQQLGQGGMGVVYEATQESLARPVAVKVLRGALAENAEAVQRFRSEAERAGRLAHPHIVGVLDFGAEPGGMAWIAMELLAGEALSTRIARGPLPEAEAARVGLETLSALEAAHAARLVHRDLKPDNIFLASVPGIGASVKVLDFGIAKLLEGEAAQKLTATGMLVGTPLYMSPEQARGEEVDERADLYSLGAVLYEALVGKPPLEGQNYNALLYAILSERPQPIAVLRPGISPALAAVVDRALAKDPAARFSNAREMAEALARAAGVEAPGRPHAMAAASPGGQMALAETMATPHPDATPAAAPVGRASSRPVPLTRPGDAPPLREGRLQFWQLAVAGGVLASALLVLGGGGLLVLDRDSPEGMARPALGLDSESPGSVPAAQPVAPPSPLAEVQDAGPPDAGTSADTRGPAVAPHAATGGRASSSGTGGPPREAPGVGEAPQQAPGGGGDGPPAETRQRVRRRPAPGPGANVRVTAAGGVFGPFRGMGSHAVTGPVNEAWNWSSCWPDSEPFPERNWGRSFDVDVAADGRVTGGRVQPRSLEPRALSDCVVQHLPGIQLPAPTEGEAATFRLHFRLYTTEQ